MSNSKHSYEPYSSALKARTVTLKLFAMTHEVTMVHHVYVAEKMSQRGRPTRHVSSTTDSSDFSYGELIKGATYPAKCHPRRTDTASRGNARAAAPLIATTTTTTTNEGQSTPARSAAETELEPQ
ncbi:hypothetical protein N7509_000045 [Penicillium cosmopolitanum]|uniref:Uncharacterized protein n=1 Tax=Penicillium cosmopolitanum TaxID=1131564 RepID=A0A9X0BF60_9EURO|nr:uncharacterized protein N7509_000045 [Penicillium cosmopolitanum]KAJ5414947.1 hypothetical protein N7509_000045 [Penicillium cosmopolitanum]